MTDGGLPPQPHSDDLTLLRTGIDAVLATNLDCLPVADLLDRGQLQILSARIDAARAAVLAASDSASEAPGVLRDLGFRTASQVVAAETGAPAREIHSTARTGQWLNQFPLFAQAAADGVLTLRHLRELKTLDRPQRHDGLIASQDELVAAARDHDFVEFTGRIITVWLINHTTSDEVAEQVKKTSCTWNTNTDGSIDGRFHLDPLSAAAVGTALGDEMQRLFRQQFEGDGNADFPNRRRGQALVGLVVGGAEAPGSATTTPLVNLVIGQKVLENFLERHLDPDTPAVPVDRDDPDYRCERIDGTPIHPDLGFVATAVAEFERIVLDERSRVIDMSVKARGFPPWMKRALLIEARAMMQFGLASQVQPEFAIRQTRPIRHGRSFDVCRRQTRVCRAAPGNTAIRTTSGSAISWPEQGDSEQSAPQQAT
jgi:hypothetical protein